MRMVKAALGRTGNIESIFRCQYDNRELAATTSGSANAMATMVHQLRSFD